MTQIWKLAENDGAIEEVIGGWLPFHAKSFEYACYSGVGRCYDDYIDKPSARLINAFPIVSKGKEFIESFNKEFKNIRINLLHEGPTLKMLEEFPYYSGNTTEVDTLPIALDMTFSEEYERTVQWYLMVPLLQLVRGFGPRYEFYKVYEEKPELADVVKTSSEIRVGKYHEVPYGMWSAVPIDLETFMLLDSPELINKVLKDTDKVHFLPYGSTICRMLNSYVAVEKRKEAKDDVEDVEEVWEEYQDEYYEEVVDQYDEHDNPYDE